MTEPASSASSAEIASVVASPRRASLSDVDDVVGGALARSFAPAERIGSSEAGITGSADALMQLIGGVLSLPGTLVDAGLAGITSAMVPPGMGTPAANIGLGMHLGLPHLHPQTALLGTPLPSFGPTVMVGALDVMIGGMPALRCGDVGFAFGCLGWPTFEVFTGSSNVFIGGKRAARGLDLTRHCNPFAALLRPASAAIGATFDLMTCAAAATNALAHTANAMDAAQAASRRNDPVEAEIARAEVGAEIRVAIVGTVQALADAPLSTLTALIGQIPPVGLTGDGLVIGAVVPTVLIGGLPLPAIGDLVNAWAHHFLQRLDAHARRRLSGHPDASGVHRPCGEPVDAFDGSVFANSTDVRLEHFALTRHYDTRDVERPSSMGRGNRHGLDRELHVRLHRVTYVDPKGVRFELPPFRGAREVSLHGCVARRLGGDQYEISHRGETMTFAAQEGARTAALVAIAGPAGTLRIERDGRGQIDRAVTSTDVFTFHYDEQDRIRAIADSRGRVLGRYAYDHAGCLECFTDALGHPQRFSYDASARLVRYRDARGHAFEWRYDASGRCVATTGDDGQWQYAFEYAALETRVTDARGNVSVRHFDSRGIVTRVVWPDGGILLREPAPDGRMLREIDSAGRVTRWLYDETGAHTGRFDAYGHELPPALESVRGASPFARELPSDLFTQLGLSGPPAPETPALAGEPSALAVWAIPQVPSLEAPRAELDLLGRVSRVLDRRGRATTYRRDPAGNVVEIIDRDGGTTRLEIGGWNLVHAEIDGLGHRRAFTYDAEERVVSYRDPNGTVTEYGRDACGRVTRIVRNGELVAEHVFDRGDRLVEKRGGRGETLFRVRPHANALPGEISLASGGRIVFDYDARGRHTRASTAAHDARLERDESGRIAFDRRNGLGVRRWRNGARETTSLFERFEVEATHESGVTTLRDCAGALHSFVHEASGRIVCSSSTRSSSNGTTRVLAFDEDGRLVGQIAHRGWNDPGAWGARYERSAHGDLLAEHDTRRGTRLFEVDAAHRLAAEHVDGRRLVHRLDAANAVVERPSAGRIEVSADGRVLGTSRETFEHDARGRLSVRRSATSQVSYSYDSLDQLVRVEDGGDAWTATYDGLGRRCRFGRSGRETEFFWDGDRIAAEVHADGSLRVHLYARVDALVPFGFVDYAGVHADPASGRSCTVSHDASGMPLRVEDASGHVVWEALHVDPFGQLTLSERNTIDYDLRWPGHYFDRDLRLHYNRFRDYDPALACYLQPDPLGHAGSPGSLHAYAPNPLVAVDLLGLHDPAHPHQPAVAEGEGARPLVEQPPDPPGTRRNAIGRLYDALTSKFVTDPAARGSGAPDILRTRTKLTGRVSLDPSDPRVRAALSARLRARARLVIAIATGDEAGERRAAHDSNRATETLGDLAAEAYVRAEYPDATLVRRDSESGTFDQVWQTPGPPPRTIVVEAKGGSGAEGSRMFGDARVQQGTPEYRESVALAMMRRPDRAAVGRLVYESGDDTIYLSVRQPIGPGGSLGALRVHAYGDSVNRDGSKSHRRTPGGRPIPRTGAAPTPTTSAPPP